MVHLIEAMNASPTHSKVRAELHLSSPFFVAGQDISGKLTLESRADGSKGLALGSISVELVASQELSSRDHSAMSIFIHSNRMFQGPGLPPSNAVNPLPRHLDEHTEHPLPHNYFPARKGVTTFFYSIRTPLSSPSSISFQGIACIRYTIKASVEVLYRGESKVVTSQIDAQVVESMPSDITAKVETVAVTDGGRLWMHATLESPFVVAGSSTGVVLTVKNHGNQVINSITLSLIRTLHLSSSHFDHHANVDNPHMSDTLFKIPFKDDQYMIYPQSERTVSLRFELPRAARGVKDGARSDLDGRITGSLFDVSHLKDASLKLLIPVLHQSAVSPLDRRSHSPYRREYGSPTPLRDYIPHHISPLGRGPPAAHSPHPTHSPTACESVSYYNHDACRNQLPYPLPPATDESPIPQLLSPHTPVETAIDRVEHEYKLTPWGEPYLDARDDKGSINEHWDYSTLKRTSGNEFQALSRASDNICSDTINCPLSASPTLKDSAAQNMLSKSLDRDILSVAVRNEGVRAKSSSPPHGRSLEHARLSTIQSQLTTNMWQASPVLSPRPTLNTHHSFEDIAETPSRSDRVLELERIVAQDDDDSLSREKPLPARIDSRLSRTPSESALCQEITTGTGDEEMSVLIRRAGLEPASKNSEASKAGLDALEVRLLRDVGTKKVKMDAHMYGFSSAAPADSGAQPLEGSLLAPSADPNVSTEYSKEDSTHPVPLHSPHPRLASADTVQHQKLVAGEVRRLRKHSRGLVAEWLDGIDNTDQPRQTEPKAIATANGVAAVSLTVTENFTLSPVVDLKEETAIRGYDIRSARGGRGGVVTAVGAIWANNYDKLLSPTGTKPIAQKSATPRSSPIAVIPLRKYNPTNSVPPPTTLEKSPVLPTLLSSKLAIPHISSTASLVRASPNQIRASMPTISEVIVKTEDSSSYPPKPVQGQGAGRAKLKELIRKYDQALPQS